MIQVISRSAQILSFLNAHRGASMQDIAKAAKLKFTTVCNIVRTLVDIGWVVKEDGHYSIGQGLLTFAAGDMRKNMLGHIADENARILSKEINEGVVISMLYGGEKYNLVKISPDREIAVNDNFQFQASPFATADGRLLIAYADDAARSMAIEKYGMPGELWNNIRSASALTAVGAEIKKAGVSIRTSADSEICGIAVPIPAADGAIWGALGVFMPIHRCTDEYKGAIINAMKRTAQRMSDLIKNQQGAAQ